MPQWFTVFATQNPIDFEGTYPLPEAQLDRFLLKIKVRYPNADEERQMLERHHGTSVNLLDDAKIQPLTAELLEAARNEIRAPAPPSVCCAWPRPSPLLKTATT